MPPRETRVRRSINFKLGCLVAGAVAVAAVTIGLAMALHELGRFAAERREALFATASAFSSAVADPLAAGDAPSIRKALRAISKLPGVVEAEVHAADGSLVADLGGAARLSDDVDLTEATDAFVNLRLLTAYTVKVSVPVVSSGSDIGRLVLINETGDILGALGELMLGVVAAGVLALAVGLGFSLRLQRGITRPIVELAARMSSIRETHDYTTTIDVGGADETTVLALSFNAMISEILERDRALLRHQQHLESEVEARTLDLSHAKAAAEAANQAKSTFLATMSHEIRTPMNGMLAMAELLATSELPARQQRYAEVIARSGQSLVAIINDILDLSKVEAGKMDLEATPVSICDVVDTVTALFGERAQSKGLDLAAFVSADLPSTMIGDEVRLTQIISNLVNNALKFTEKGHVVVRALRAGDHLRIEVVDTGVGIAEDKLGQIFESFTQAEQSTARRFGGTGLGLSICQKLVHAMNGEIGVDSRIDRGSTFWVKLPVESESASPVSQLSSSGFPVQVATERRAVLQSLLDSLREAGVSASSDTSEVAGQACWIVDASALRRDDRRPQDAIAVIAIASSSETEADDLLRAGLADRVLAWPVAQSELRPLIGQIQAGKIQPSAPRATQAPQTRFDGATVLVADDSPVNREVAVEALKRFGVAARCVDDGRAALEAMTAERFDLVLMDGSMPVLDGFSATRELRAIESATGRPRTTVVALTAHVLGAQASEWADAGMDDVLHKPLSMAKLETCLTRWIAGDRTAAPADDRGPTSEAAAPILNEETLLQLEALSAASGGAFVERVFSLFKEQSARLMDTLTAAAAERHAVGAAHAAHALKSTSLNIGASALAGLAADIELAAKESGVAPPEDDLSRLRGSLTIAISALAERLRIHGGSEAPSALSEGQLRNHAI